MIHVHAVVGKNTKTVVERMNKMNAYNENLKLASNLIKSKVKKCPVHAIVLGSGLSSLADDLEEITEICYNEIPGFSDVSVPGHEGKLIIGKLSGIGVILLKGRFHYYEGHDIDSVVFPIRVLLTLGIKNLILTNAAGAINKEFSPGEMMIIKDHIGLYCESPLRGPNFDEFGPRFPDQSNVYNYKNALEVAKQNNINVRIGVYAYTKGPMFETPAEIRMLKILGVDAVGMSTVPEAIVASHGGMNVIGISCVTNFAAGILEQPLSHKEVLEVGKKGAKSIKKLIENIIKDWDMKKWA